MNNADTMGALSLFAWTAEQLPLVDALEAAQRCFPDGAVGQLYSAAACRLARYRDATLFDDEDTQLDTGSIF